MTNSSLQPFHSISLIDLYNRFKNISTCRVELDKKSRRITIFNGPVMTKITFPQTSYNGSMEYIVFEPHSIKVVFILTTEKSEHKGGVFSGFSVSPFWDTLDIVNTVYGLINFCKGQVKALKSENEAYTQGDNLLVKLSELYEEQFSTAKFVKEKSSHSPKGITIRYARTMSIAYRLQKPFKAELKQDPGRKQEYSALYLVIPKKGYVYRVVVDDNLEVYIHKIRTATGKIAITISFPPTALPEDLEEYFRLRKSKTEEADAYRERLYFKYRQPSLF